MSEIYKDTIKVIQTLKDCLSQTENCDHKCFNCLRSVTVSEVIRAYDNVLTILKELSSGQPMFVKDGVALFLTQGHVEALLEYDKQEYTKEAIKRIKEELKSLPDDMSPLKPFQIPLKPLDNAVVKLNIGDPIVNEEGKAIFNGICPYEGKPCESWTCCECSVEERERKFMEGDNE